MRGLANLLGRKTGVTLRDSGMRDEWGMAPLEDMFSSPNKPNSDDQTEGVDMDIDDSTNALSSSLVPAFSQLTM
jgi:centromere protein C